MSWLKQLDISSIQEQAAGMFSNLELLNLDQMAEKQEKEQELKQMVEKINDDVNNSFDDIFDDHNSNFENNINNNNNNNNNLINNPSFSSEPLLNINQINEISDENSLKNSIVQSSSDDSIKVLSPINNEIKETEISQPSINTTQNSLITSRESFPPSVDQQENILTKPVKLKDPESSFTDWSSGFSTPTPQKNNSNSLFSPIKSNSNLNSSLNLSTKKVKKNDNLENTTSDTSTSYFSKLPDNSQTLNIYTEDDEEAQLPVLSVLPKNFKNDQKLHINNKNESTSNSNAYKYSSTLPLFQFDKNNNDEDQKKKTENEKIYKNSIYNELVISTIKEMQESYFSFLNSLQDLKNDTLYSSPSSFIIPSSSNVTLSSIFLILVKFIGMIICVLLFCVHILYLLFCKPIIILISHTCQSIFNNGSNDSQGLLSICCLKIKELIEGSGISGSFIRDISSAQNNKFILIVIMSLFILSIWHFENYINHST